MQWMRLHGLVRRHARMRMGFFSTETDSIGKHVSKSPLVRRFQSRRRTVAVATASAVVALGLASTTEDSAIYPLAQQHFLLLRSGWLLSAAFVAHTEFQRDFFGQTDENDQETRAHRRIQWWEAIHHAGSNDTSLQERMVTVIANLMTSEPEEFANEQHKLVTTLVDRGAIAVLVDYVAQEQPLDRTLLDKIARSLVVGLEDVLRREAVGGPVSVSLVSLGVALNLLLDKDVMRYSDLILLGESLLRLDENTDTDGLEAGAFVVPSSSSLPADVSRAINGYQRMLSPELPPANKEFALHALNQLVRASVRQSRYQGTRSLDGLMTPVSATLVLALPRGNVRLQQRAAVLMAALLEAAQAASTPVAADVYELWMQQIRTWLNATTPSPLQLVGASCLRTLSSHPRTRQLVRESDDTMTALFTLARHLHEDHPPPPPHAPRHSSRKRPMAMPSLFDQLERVLIQKHLSKAFMNICMAFQSGETAMLETIDATTGLLHSRRTLPMSSVFRGAQDLTDLPVIGAEEYDASTEFGWADILTRWTGSSDRDIRQHAIQSLVHLIEQDCETEVGVQKQQHLLQAWLASMLQHVRNVTGGGEILAIKQVEDIARISDELTPGNEKVLFNPAVVDAGASALAVLAEQHYDELIHYGVVLLMSLLARKCPSNERFDFETQSARVIANLVAACCKTLEDGYHSSQEMATPTSAMGEMAKTNVVVFAQPFSTTHPLWKTFFTEVFDVGQMLEMSTSGQTLLRMLHTWKNRKDPQERSQLYRALANLKAYRELARTGRRTLPIYAEGVHPIVAQGSEDLEDFTQTHADVDIVFIHGLRGDAFGTWRTDMGDAIDSKTDIWPDILLCDDLKRQGVRPRVLSLGYEAGMVSWSSPWPSLTLQERASVMLKALYDANVGHQDGIATEPRPVVFITHSMGGILAKKMLLQSQLDKESDDQPSDRITLAEATRAVVFLAVPHFGSDLARGIRSEAVRSLLRTHPAIQDLCASHDRRLESLNDSFAALHIDTLSIAEQKPAPLGFGLSAVVVKPESANPGIGEFFILPSADHMTICKAKTRQNPMYESVLSYVERHIDAVAPVVRE